MTPQELLALQAKPLPNPSRFKADPVNMKLRFTQYVNATQVADQFTWSVKRPETQAFSVFQSSVTVQKSKKAEPEQSSIPN